MTDVIFHPCRECRKSFPRTGTKSTVHCMFCGAPHIFSTDFDSKRSLESSSEPIVSFVPPAKKYLFLCPDCNLYRSASYKAQCDECKNSTVQLAEKKDASVALNRYKDKAQVTSLNSYESSGPKHIPNSNNRVPAPVEDDGWLPSIVGAIIIIAVVGAILNWTGMLGKEPDCPAYLDECGPDYGDSRHSFPTL